MTLVLALGIGGIVAYAAHHSGRLAGDTFPGRAGVQRRG
jgi:hypothetical protein